MIEKYTVAEFRKNIRQAFNTLDNGGQVFISRHGTRYEVRIADVQSGKKQFEKPVKIHPVAKEIIEDIKAIPFPDNGDAGAQVESADDFSDVFGAAPAKKNIAEGKPSELEPLDRNFATIYQWGNEQLSEARKEIQTALDAIDINTQDPDEIERGTELSARLADVAAELKKRGSE